MKRIKVKTDLYICHSAEEQLSPSIHFRELIQERWTPTYLVADGGDEAVELGIAGELGDMLDQPLDHLGVSLPEGRHQAGHLPVVLTVDVRAWNRQQLVKTNEKKPKN